MPTPRPSLRFFHSAQLRARTLKVLASLDRASDPTVHIDELASLITSLTEAGIDYYFLKPMREAKLRYIAPRTAEVAVAGAIRALSPVLRSILRSATSAQLRLVTKHIRSLMA